MPADQEPTSSAELAARDRHARARAAAMTPGERLAAMRDLIARSWALLEANPDGMARFLRRNHHSRAVRPAGGGASHGT
ncbi:MAG: hypothetical protein ACKOZU_05785 [Planctomycetaceae bacterium]